jgi:xylulokinase
LVFLPYLSGERTPHNNAAATGVFFGLTSSHRRVNLARAVVEGVAFALADGVAALEMRGERIASLIAIGGGARSDIWLRILASVLERPLRTVRGGDVGPALGAAQLARIALGAGSVEDICVSPPTAGEFVPDAALASQLAPRRDLYRRLYAALQHLYTAGLVEGSFRT